MADELQAQCLMFGAELQAVGLGLPPAMPTELGFGRHRQVVLQQRPAFLELPLEDVVQQGAIGTASWKSVVAGLRSGCSFCCSFC